jgi:hypothetical protein
LPDLLLEGQPFLYTNSNQEGILQANTRPPRADDVTVFKGYSFYANTVQYHLLSLTTVDPNLIANGDTLTLTDGTTTETYVFVASQNPGPPIVETNEAIGNESVTLSATVAAGTATITSTRHGFLSGDVIRVYIGKLNEPEAVPLFNIRDVGSKASPILRVAALRDSVIILKDDGIYRLNGDTVNNFTVTALDNTVFVKATDSVVVLNNSVYCLSNQGVVQITDSAVRIVSRIIEPLLTAILGQDLEDNTSAVGYESERIYLLSVKRPNTLSSVADVTYCYN